MKHASILATVAAALLVCAPAIAQELALAPPMGPKPGPEIEALKAIARDWTFKSHIVENLMWQGAPSAPAHGFWKCDWIMGGLWASCHMEDTIGPVKDGKGPLADGKTWTWKGQMFMGWDIEDNVYRMIGVDNETGAYNWAGRKEGVKFIFESEDYRTSQGIQQKFRFIWDLSDPNAVKFSQENQVKGETVWKPLEIATYTPAKLPR